MGLRAFWTQQTTLATTDRIEIHIDGFDGAPRKLTSNNKGFTFRHDEITAESSVFLSPNQNKIQQGKLDFYPKIRTAEDRQVLKDIADSDDYSVLIKWIVDGGFEWKGYSNSKLLQGQESAIYSGRIRANDFEILKGIDFPLASGRKVLIISLAEILGYTNFDLNIQTSTSWTVEGGEESEDFLNQVAHDQYALRSYGKTGNEQDEPITGWQAMERVAEPGLLIRQQHGKILVEQLTAFDDPQNVSQTLYDPSGNIINATQPVDRRQTIYTSGSLGSPHVKRTSSTDAYPAIKRAVVKYDHRTRQNNIKFPDSAFVIPNQQVSRTFSQLFISDGSQIISLSFNVNVDLPSNTGLPEMQWRITAGGYSWSADAGEWQPGVFFNVKPLSGGDFQSAQGNYKYFANFNIYTEPTPPDADGQLEIEIQRVPGGVNGTTISVSNFEIINGLSAANTSYIQYQLTQQGGYPDKYTHEDTFFGEGPVDFSRGALSVGSTYLYDAFARRGETEYRKYHRVLLEEIIHTQRKRMPKITAEIIGHYDPEKISIYRGKAYYYSGGKYRAVIGRWEPVWIEIDVESEPADIFQDINKYDDGGGASGGSVGLPGSGGGGGVTDHGQLDGLEDDDHPQYLTEARGDARYPRLDADNEWTGQNTFTQQAIFADGLNLPNASPIQSGGNNALEFDAMGNVTVPGNLEVLGETLSANVENLDVDDPIIKLADGNVTDALDIGFVGQRSSGNVGFIWDESADEFAAVATDSNAETGNININGYLDLRLRGVTIDPELGFLRSADLNGFDFVSQGVGIQKNERGEWTAVFDNIVGRKRLKVFELLFEEIQVFAKFLLNEANKVDETEQVGFGGWSWTDDINPFAPGATNENGIPYSWTDQYRCYIDKNARVQLAADDLVQRQAFSGNEVGVTQAVVIGVEQGAADPADNSTRRYFDIALYNGGGPTPGQTFARLGNRTNAERMGGIYFAGSGAGAPHSFMYDGVDRFDKFGSAETIKDFRGNTQGRTFPKFDNLDGSQGRLYANITQDGYYSGIINVTGGNAATKDFVSDFVDGAVSEADGTAELRAELDAIFDNAITNEDTIIVGGYIKTSYLELDAILVGDLADGASYETKTGAQGKVNSLQGDIDAVFDNAIADGTTIIVNGFIKTDFIDVDQLLAQDATITGSLSNPANDYIIDQDGIRLVAKLSESSFDVAREVSWVGKDDPDKIIASMYGFTFDQSAPYSDSDSRLLINVGSGNGAVRINADIATTASFSAAGKISTPEDLEIGRWQYFNNEIKFLSGSTEKGISIDKQHVFINATSGEPRLTKIVGLPTNGKSMRITLINESNGNDIILVDQSNAGLSGSNFRTQNGSDIRFYDGASVDLIWDGSSTLYVQIDRGN